MSNVKCGEFQSILDKAIDSDGKIALPNISLLGDTEALWQVACASKLEKRPYRFKTRDFDPPIGHGQTHEILYYPKIFTHGAGMGGTFEGSGVILSASGGKPVAYSFRMCEHVWNESGANHQRGWHPKRCTKCGFNASIDSGD